MRWLSFRDGLMQVHLWLALILCLPMFIIGIHAFLAMPPPIGLPFVGWTGVIMTLMGLSGLVLWWPRQGQWRQGFLLRRGTRGLPFYFDLHRVAGTWGLLVFLAVSTSG